MLSWVTIWLLSFFPTRSEGLWRQDQHWFCSTLCLQHILEKVITTLTFSDCLFKQQMDEQIITVISYSKCPTYLALQVYVLQKKKRKLETLMTVCCSWSELVHSNQCSSLSPGRTGLYRTQATSFTLNLPTDLGDCEVIFLHSVPTLHSRYGHRNLLEYHFPINISMSSPTKPGPAGGVSFASEGIKILLSKPLPSQTSFEIWGQHRFNMMLLAFPEACSRKVSYIKLAGIMFGLIDFFF